MTRPGVTARSVRIDDELWARALVVAAEEGETLSDIMRDAVRDYVAASSPEVADLDEEVE